MIHRKLIKTLLVVATIFSLLSVSNNVLAGGDPAKGKELFLNNCAACHNVTMKKDATGPALKGVEERWGDEKRLHAWIRNNAALRASGDKYANEIFAKWNNVVMTNFTSFSDEDINNILAFVKQEADKPDAVPTAPGGAGAEVASDNSTLYALLTIILVALGLILLQVNSNLKKLSDDKEGIRAPEPVPFWRNKAYISVVIIALAIGAGVWVSSAAIGLGRQKNYQPEQPIYYSHKVHAGVNQINCLYCHGGAQESKHANIPSVNVCMNCHMGINEYKGEKIFREDGTEVDGTKEIQKLYAAAGYDPAVSKKWDPSKAKPIEWVKIHSLPDHVYFNHSQHVKAGQVQCQTCHGPITEMNEVYQFAELSMGWCINCHRETKVNFYDDSTKQGNKFYSMYERFHNELKSGKIDSVTVEKIGGTECQKCHY